MEGVPVIPMQLGPEKVLEQVGRRLSPFFWGEGRDLEMLWDICLPPEEGLTGKRRQTDEKQSESRQVWRGPLKLQVQQHLKSKPTIPFLLTSTGGLLPTCNRKACY